MIFFQAALVAYGPLSVALDATNLQSYTGGVFGNSSGCGKYITVNNKLFVINSL